MGRIQGAGMSSRLGGAPSLEAGMQGPACMWAGALCSFLDLS